MFGIKIIATHKSCKCEHDHNFCCPPSAPTMNVNKMNHITCKGMGAYVSGGIIVMVGIVTQHRAQVKSYCCINYCQLLVCEGEGALYAGMFIQSCINLAPCGFYSDMV